MTRVRPGLTADPGPQVWRLGEYTTRRSVPAQDWTGRAPGLVLLCAGAVLAFFPALSAGFLYDDLRDVVQNPAAQAAIFLDRLPHTLRPMTKASYALQDALTGMAPTPFHAVNIALHLAAVLMLRALVTRWARMAGYPGAAADRIGWSCALVWAVHPALAETVAYVSGRSVGLSSVLVLGCLLATTAERPRPALALGLAALAPLARETALVTPLLLLAWQITLGRNERAPLAMRRALPVWAGAALAALVIAAMARHRELVAFSLETRPPLEALRANVFALPEILRLWVEPWRVSVLPPQPVFFGWTDPPTLIRLAGLMALPVVALVLRRKVPLVALAVLWTLLALMPTNSLIWRVDPVATRPLYLAGIGLSMLAALALLQVRGMLWLAAGLALWLGLQTWERSRLYQDEVALFADAAERFPGNSRAHFMHGLVLANAGHTEEARRALETAIVIDPYLPGAENALRLLDVGAGVYSAPP